MRPRFTKTIRWAWMLTCLAVLIYGEYVFDGTPNSDAEYVLVTLMCALSFPSCFAAGGVIVFILFVSEHEFAYPLRVSRLMMFSEWLLFALAGYVQWFVVTPRIWSIFKEAAATKHQRS